MKELNKIEAEQTLLILEIRKVVKANKKLKKPQSRQSARLFSSRPNWDPHPLTRKQASVSLPLVPGGTHSLVGEGVGVPIRMRGQTLVVHYRFLCTFLKFNKEDFGLKPNNSLKITVLLK